MRRLLLLALLTLALIATACAGTAPVAEPLRGFDGELLDPDDETLGASNLTTPASTSDQDAYATTVAQPSDLAFSDGGQVAPTPTAEDGVCAVLDRTFDDHFSQSDPLSGPFGEDRVEATSALLASVSDGPFGAEWSRFAEVGFSEGNGALGSDEFGIDWILATDQLAENQCGFPAMTTLIKAFTPDCLTPISASGERGETTCTNQPDPR